MIRSKSLCMGGLVLERVAGVRRGRWEDNWQEGRASNLTAFQSREPDCILSEAVRQHVPQL